MSGAAGVSDGGAVAWTTDAPDEGSGGSSVSTTTGSCTAAPSAGVPAGPDPVTEAAPIAMTTSSGTEANATSIATINVYRRVVPDTP